MAHEHLPGRGCRACGASSYRRVVERDESGAMRATSLYQCSGCSVAFADPAAWRGWQPDDAPAPPPPPPKPMPYSLEQWRGDFAPGGARRIALSKS